MNPSPPFRLGFAALARTTFDIELAAQVAARAREALSCLGTLITHEGLLSCVEEADTVFAETTDPLDALVVFQATFSDSTLVVHLAEHVRAPIFLWAVPEERTGERLRLNSLCGINLAAHALKQRNIPFAWGYARPGDPDVLTRIRAWASAGRAYRTLAQQAVGLFGEPPLGFDSCEFDSELLNQALGTRVLRFSIAEIFKRAQENIAQGMTVQLRHELSHVIPNLGSLDPIATEKTLGTYLALQQVAQETGCAAVAVRCWPEFFTQFGGAACGALSLLNTNGVPCSCEADVHGAISQLMLQAVSGEPTFGFDLVHVDTADNTAVVWHCGQAPLTMANPTHPVLGEVHSNRKLPLSMSFPLKPGRVTIARLSRHNAGLRLVLGGGEMLNAPPSFSGTSGVLRFDLPASEVLERILNEGIEHHLTLTYGDHIQALCDLAQMTRLPVFRLC